MRLHQHIRPEQTFFCGLINKLARSWIKISTPIGEFGDLTHLWEGLFQLKKIILNWVDGARIFLEVCDCDFSLMFSKRKRDWIVCYNDRKRRFCSVFFFSQFFLVNALTQLIPSNPDLDLNINSTWGIIWKSLECIMCRQDKYGT